MNKLPEAKANKKLPKLGYRTSSGWVVKEYVTIMNEIMCHWVHECTYCGQPEACYYNSPYEPTFNGYAPSHGSPFQCIEYLRKEVEHREYKSSGYRSEPETIYYK